jgi:hypothetical protein
MDKEQNIIPTQEHFVGTFRIEDPTQPLCMMRYNTTGVGQIGLSMQPISIQDFYSNDLDACLDNAIEKMLVLSRPNTVKTKKSTTSYRLLMRHSFDIVQKTRRAPANFIIGRKDLVECFFSEPLTFGGGTNIEYFDNSPFGRAARYSILLKDLGDRVLIGYKGPSAYDSGVMIIENPYNKSFLYSVCVGPVGSEIYYTQFQVVP